MGSCLYHGFVAQYCLLHNGLLSLLYYCFVLTLRVALPQWTHNINSCLYASTEQGSGVGEQQQPSMSNNTPLSQPSSQGGYPGYQQQQLQQPYQPWGQPPPQSAEGGGAPPQPDIPSRSPEPSPPQAQRTPEEEAYWADMSNKKVGETI